jgi:hypothetical protein
LCFLKDKISLKFQFEPNSNKFRTKIEQIRTKRGDIAGARLLFPHFRNFIFDIFEKILVLFVFFEKQIFIENFDEIYSNKFELKRRYCRRHVSFSTLSE